MTTERPEFSGWDNAKRAAAFLRTHAGMAARTCGLWLLILVGTAVALTPVAVWLVQNDPDFAAFIRSFEDQRVLELVLAAPFALLMAVAWPSIAVAWHRFTLRREAPSLLPFSPLKGVVYLAVVAFFFILAWVLPFMLLGFLVVGFNLKTSPMPYMIAFALFAALLGLSMRFSLKLPAIALGDRTMTLARSWTSTEIMWPGMLWGTVVLTVPFYIGSSAINYVAARLGEAGETQVSLLLSALGLLVIFAGLLLYSTFLSFSYQAAVGDPSASEVFA